MKISMWVIADEFSDLHPTLNIISGEMILEDFRFLSGDESPLEKYLYVVSEKEITLQNQNDTIKFSDCDVFDLVNRVADVFEKYRNWDNKLLLSLNDPGTPLQSIIDTAHDIFQCPMLFGSIDRHIYAMTYQYDSSEVYDGWDEVKKHHSMTFALNERLHSFFEANKHIASSQEEKQAIEPVWKGMKFEHQIRTNCYLNETVWGHFYLYYKKSDVSPSVLQLAQHVGSIFDMWIKDNSTKTSPRYFKYSWLIDVLNGLTPNETAIANLYHSLNWRFDAELVLFKIDSNDDSYDRMMFYWLCKSVDALSKNIVFPYGHSVIVIAKIDDNLEYFTGSISHLIGFNQYHCGISLPFVGLHKISSYLRQAEYAIEYAPDPGTKIHHYKDCMMEGITAELKHANPNWKEWILPSLMKLYEDEQETKKDYIATLHNYILYNTIADTAANMHIHRNTLIYRLEKIRNNYGINLDDSKMRAYILLCLMLLKET